MTILPCPFCGQVPDTSDGDFCYPIIRDNRFYRAGCIESHGGCGAEVIGESPERAIEKWNTRVSNFDFHDEMRAKSFMTNHRMAF